MKGSTYKRQILEKGDDFDFMMRDKNIALKDVDLMNNQNRRFDISQHVKEKYVMLLCIEFINKF